MDTREVITAYLEAVESHDLDRVAGWLHPDVELVEHPNKISPAGMHADKAAMRAAGERGKTLLAKERYAVRSMIVEGPRAAVLLVWSGTLPDGRVMTAQICSVIELRDGKVWRQEQYDCFEP
ncbi:MAG: nuclear transport factor 2 family protein [Kofleriaceae bacterium]